MTKMQWQQEYLGEFVDNLMQLFSDKLIKSCQTLSRSKGTIGSINCFLGVDIARMGGDETTFQILNRDDNKKLKQVESIAETDKTTTDTFRDILQLESKYKFKKIYIDDGGLGVGVFDNLLEDPATKRKVIGINNARRSITYDPEKPKQKKLMKEDLYNNLLNLMEQDRIKLLDDPEIFQSLKSVQFEFNDSGQMRIFGRYTHIAEGLIRAAWCTKDKSLNLWCRY